MLLEIIQKIQVEEEEAEALIGREVGRERLQLQAEMELQFSKFTRLGLFIVWYCYLNIQHPLLLSLCIII